MKNKKLIIIGAIAIIIIIILIAKSNSSSNSKIPSNNTLINNSDTYIAETKNEQKDNDNNSPKFVIYNYIKELATLEYPSNNEEWCYNVYTDNTGTYENKFVELTECAIDKSTTSITIPNEIEGLPVICIGDRLLNNYENLERLTIPNTIIHIGNEACCNCSSLSDIRIPNSVTVIGDYAFAGHGFFKIGTLEIPEGVVEIGKCAFWSYIGKNGYLNQDLGFEKVILPKSLERIHYSTFQTDEITILNPNLEFVTSYEEDFVFNHNAIVYGYSGSTAAQYCSKTGNTFKVIE